MQNIFDLTLDQNDLKSSNGGMSSLEAREINSERSATGKNFPTGTVSFKWVNGANDWSKMDMSNFRLRCSLSKANGDFLTVADGIAPAMGLGSNLFQSAQFLIGGKKVQSCDNYMAQVDALRTRLTQSRQWMETSGHTKNLWGGDFKKRQSVVASDYSNETTVGLVNTRLELEYLPATTIALSAATGVLTFSAAVPSAVDRWQTGDEITITLSATNTVRYRVSEVLTATTLQLNEQEYIGFGAAALDFERIRTEITDNDSSRKVKSFEIVWKPPMSVFDLKHCLPCGSYEIRMVPKQVSDYQAAVIESIVVKTANTTGDPANVQPPNAGFLFSVDEIKYYNYVVQGPRTDNITYFIDLEDVAIQVDDVTNITVGQEKFNVPPSTYALTLMHQDDRVLYDSRLSASRFKVRDVAALTDTSEENNLEKFSIEYAGRKLPDPDPELKFDEINHIDFTSAQFVTSLINSGSIYDNGGSELLHEWRERGAYYHYVWPKDASDRNVAVTVRETFSVGTDVTHMRMLLASHSRSTCRVQIQEGMVSEMTRTEG